MTVPVDNRGENDYHGKLASIASVLRDWRGPVVIVSHVDPDGDAVGSSLALKRALEALGKRVALPLEPPHYLTFLAREGELATPLEALPEGCLLVVLDASDPARAIGAPLEGAAFTVNIDHHGTNPRFGDLSLVQPSCAATAVIVKDLVEALVVPWNVDIATPCLTGMLTDTGNFRYGNTDRRVLEAAADLIEVGVPYTELTDRLQWRRAHYFRMLGRVMDTVAFELDGKLITAAVTEAMRREAGGEEDDSEDFVGVIRYAEGTAVAALLKEREEGVKVSVRARPGVSAQAICVELGGGGHVAAAGATIHANLDEARRLLREAVARELERAGVASPRAGAPAR